MSGQTCLKCEQPLTAPGTPARAWAAGRHRPGVLCGPCLGACGGSLLYSVPGDDLAAALLAWTPAERAAWLDSLVFRDREEARAFAKRRGIPL